MLQPNKNIAAFEKQLLNKKIYHSNVVPIPYETKILKFQHILSLAVLITNKYCLVQLCY